MKKWIFSLAFVMTSQIADSSFQNMIDHDHFHAPKRFFESEAGYVSPDAIEDRILTVKAMHIQGFRGESSEKLQNAFRLLELAVNSREFKDRIINFKNDKGERQFASNKGLTNEEIYQFIMDGRETLQVNTPGEMNFFLRLYYRPWSRVIGYTSGDTNLISVNWRFFKNYEPHNVAANLAHEWTHKIGFGHRSAKEHDSVPYAVGYIIGDIAQKMSRQGQLH